MKILIAGGTGFIGSHIVQKLKQNGHSPIVLSRHGQIPADVTKPDTLTKVPWNDFDAVVICVQFPNHPVQNYSRGYTYENFDATGTENLCQQIAKSKIEKVIYVSGAGTAPEKPQPWFKAKIRAEAAVIKTGKNYVIFRPSWIYGPGDKSMSRFLAFTKLPVMPVIGNGKNRAAPLYVDDFAELVLQAINHHQIKNATFEVGGPQNLSMNQIQQTVLDFKQKKRPLLHQPLWMMKAVGSILNALLPTPPLSAEAIDFITMDGPINNLEVEKVFKIKFKNLREGLSYYK